MALFPARARRRLFIVSGFCVFGLAVAFAAGCARDHETVQAAANAPIGIQTGQMFVTVENKAGVPLTDLEVSIIAVSNQRFIKRLERLEDGDKRDVSLSDFTGMDNTTTFNLRFNKPKSVKVTAVDMTNRKYDVEVPW